MKRIGSVFALLMCFIMIYDTVAEWYENFLRTNGNQRPPHLYSCRHWEGTRTIIRHTDSIYF